jgi:hypothetical protein
LLAQVPNATLTRQRTDDTGEAGQRHTDLGDGPKYLLRIHVLPSRRFTIRPSLVLWSYFSKKYFRSRDCCASFCGKPGKL